MSTPFEIESFEEYPKTFHDELPQGLKYFRGQTKLLSAGYQLKPSIGRYEHLSGKSFRERDEIEREVLDYEEFGLDAPEHEESGFPSETAPTPVPYRFNIKENEIYHPPHLSPRLRAQDSVLVAFHQPLSALEDSDCLEIIIRNDAHDDIRHRLDQYGVYDRQLFPDLDGISKWLKYRNFESKGVL